MEGEILETASRENSSKVVWNKGGREMECELERRWEWSSGEEENQ